MDDATIKFMDLAEARGRRISELETALSRLLSYVDAGKNLSEQSNHPAHAARLILNARKGVAGD